MCCWTRFWPCRSEATCVLRAGEIPALEHRGGVGPRVGGTDAFKPPQAEDRAEAEFCPDRSRFQLLGDWGGHLRSQTQT